MKQSIRYDGGLTLALSVSDMDASIAWYRQVLGFELVYRMDDIGWCELSTGVEQVRVGLSVTEKVTAGGATPTFGVVDIAAARKSLEAQAVKLDGDIMTIEGMVSLQTFYDPDGNSLMFYQDLSGGQDE